MNLSCPGCHRKTTFRDLDKQQSPVINCPDCGTKYHLEGKRIEEGDISYKRFRKSPDHIDVLNTISSKTIRVKNPNIFKLSLWTPFLFIVYISYLMYFSHLEYSDWNWSVLIPLGFLALVFGRHALAPFRVTVIHIDRQTITVNWKPRPLLKRKKVFELDGFTQFYVRRFVASKKQGTQAFFQLQGILRNGMGEVTILDRMGDAESTYYIEQQIEQFLRIEDEIQDEEYNPRLNLDMGPMKALKMFWQLVKQSREESKKK